MVTERFRDGNKLKVTEVWKHGGWSLPLSWAVGIELNMANIIENVAPVKQTWTKQSFDNLYCFSQVCRFPFYTRLVLYRLPPLFPVLSFSLSKLIRKLFVYLILTFAILRSQYDGNFPFRLRLYSLFRIHLFLSVRARAPPFSFLKLFSLTDILYEIKLSVPSNI